MSGSQGRTSTTTSRKALRLPLFILLLLVANHPGRANGPRSVDGTGVAMRWDNTSPIVYNRDPGSLGSLSNDQADGLVADAFSRWQGLAQVQLSFSAGADLPFDVNAVGLPLDNLAHWGHFWRRMDGLSPVIYDADGTIIRDMFGVGSEFDVLGAAGIDNPIALSGTITEASIVLNGLFYDGVDLPVSPHDSPSQLAF